MLKHRHSQIKSHQSGSILLEGLIAILIFSMGILAIIGLQATAIKTVADAQYRVEASFLASRAIADMWANYPNIPNYGSGDANYNNWLASVQRLPNGAATITKPGSLAAGYVVTVNIRWQAPGDSVQHSYTALSEIH